MSIERRYQVFVSSTFSDLQEERQEVMQALLELDCIPAGMELFPAANEDQWTLIKRVIDDCDYYIVIIGGRYGTIGSEGISYTEMEYKYALEKHKPVIGFLHKRPGDLPSNRCEESEEGRRKLEALRTFVQKKLCRFWDSPADLGSQVSRSLVQLIKAHPSPGWVRADLVPDVPAAEEILRLKKRIEELEASLSAARMEAPSGTASLAQGDDQVRLGLSFKAYSEGDLSRTSYSTHFATSWNDIFAAVSPQMIDEASDHEFRAALSKYAETQNRPVLSKDKNLKDKSLDYFQIHDDDFQTIKIQLRALGLITKSTKPRSVKDRRTYWTLTPYGDNIMTRLRAIERDADETS